MNGTDIVTRDKLVADLKVVVADAEELLRITAGQAGDKVAAVRDKMQRGLEQAKAKLADLEGKAMEQTKAAARARRSFGSCFPASPARRSGRRRKRTGSSGRWSTGPCGAR